MAQSNGARNPARSSDALFGWSLPVGFLLLAALLWMSPRRAPEPEMAAAQVDRARLVVQPRRVPVADPPRILVEGLAQRCNGCHQIFESASASGEALSYHTDVHLDHGLNARCVNCHDPGDRERLTLRDGTTVPFVQSALLCAQCHGTTYRDWQNGTHGKTLGSWVVGSESMRRLSCIECHDPHQPRYGAYEPLPGPNTLRMGPQGMDGPHGEPRSPLQRWLHGGHDEQHAGEARTGGRP